MILTNLCVSLAKKNNSWGLDETRHHRTFHENFKSRAGQILTFKISILITSTLMKIAIAKIKFPRPFKTTSTLKIVHSLCLMKDLVMMKIRNQVVACRRRMLLKNVLSAGRKLLQPIWDMPEQMPTNYMKQTLIDLKDDNKVALSHFINDDLLELVDK